jgi:protein-S-isoprenylcysteine O-methyltransferase Ste14
MTDTPQSSGRPNEVPDVAHLGRVRPPILYLTAIVAGVLLHLFRPLRFVPPTFAVLLGPAVVVIAIALFVFAVGKFRAAGTPVPAFKPTTAIVSAGPYRFSRNPIYLAFSLLQLGLAIWVNSLWVMATLVAAVAFIHFVIIPREEAYLERKFGAAYLDYKHAVRRWL